MPRPIEELSFWLSNGGAHPTRPPLKGERRADVVVIGAGFTGLWSAYFLKQLAPDTRVVVLERDFAGYGASGRNAGMICAGFDHSYALSIDHFGLEEARRLEHIGLRNCDELAEFAVDCNLERTGSLNVALTPSHLENFDDNVRAAAALGIEGISRIDAQETRALLDSPLFVGGMQNRYGGIVNPYKIVQKLLRELIAQGVEIYEHTPVTRIDGSTVITPQGRVVAHKVVLATDSFSGDLMPKLLRWFIPLYDYIIVSEPLRADQLASIGWHGRQGVWDSRTFFNYYRLTADNRILWGSGEASYYPPNDVNSSHDYSSSYTNMLLESFARHFPQLKELQFSYSWGGAIGSTTRLTPFFGQGNGGKLFYAMGYTGQGVANTRLAGKILAHQALSRESELTKLLPIVKKPMIYPPEPFRRLAVGAVTRALRRTDEGYPPSFLLRALNRFGIEFSS